MSRRSRKKYTGPKKAPTRTGRGRPAIGWNEADRSWTTSRKKAPK